MKAKGDAKRRLSKYGSRELGSPRAKGSTATSVDQILIRNN
jgi:hypothetical protein